MSGPSLVWIDSAIQVLAQAALFPEVLEDCIQKARLGSKKQSIVDLCVGVWNSCGDGRVSSVAVARALCHELEKTKGDAAESLRGNGFGAKVSRTWLQSRGDAQQWLQQACQETWKRAESGEGWDEQRETQLLLQSIEDRALTLPKDVRYVCKVVAEKGRSQGDGGAGLVSLALLRFVLPALVVGGKSEVQQRVLQVARRMQHLASKEASQQAEEGEETERIRSFLRMCCQDQHGFGEYDDGRMEVRAQVDRVEDKVLDKLLLQEVIHSMAEHAPDEHSAMRERCKYLWSERLSIEFGKKGGKDFRPQKQQQQQQQQQQQSSQKTGKNGGGGRLEISLSSGDESSDETSSSSEDVPGRKQVSAFCRWFHGFLKIGNNSSEDDYDDDDSLSSDVEEYERRRAEARASQQQRQQQQQPPPAVVATTFQPPPPVQKNDARKSQSVASSNNNNNNNNSNKQRPQKSQNASETNDFWPDSYEP